MTSVVQSIITRLLNTRACGLCTAEFPYKAAVEFHLRSSHHDTQNSSMQRRSALAKALKHLRKNPRKPIDCRVCAAKLRSVQAYRKHFIRKHALGGYSANSSAFRRLARLKILSRAPNTKTFCYLCEKVFLHDHNRRRHILYDHTGK